MSGLTLFWKSDRDRDDLLTLQESYKFAGRFRLIQLIGQGGFGQVWRVEDTELNQEVALKISTNGLVSETIFLRQMSRSRYVSIFDFVSDSNIGAQGYSMELLDSPWTTLDIYKSKYLNKKLIDRRTVVDAVLEIISIAIDILISLRELHGKKHGKVDRLVHADVKPQNIYINRNLIKRYLSQDMNEEIVESFTKIGDLGLTCEAGSPSAGATPSFRAPEQDECGNPVSDATDLFAIGQTIAYLLIGYPFGKEDLKHVKRIHEAIAKVIPSTYLVKNIAKVLRTLTHKEQAARGNADSAIQALSDLRSETDFFQITSAFLNEKIDAPLLITQAAEMIFYYLKDAKGWGKKTDARIVEVKIIIRNAQKHGVLGLDGKKYYLK